MKNSPADFRIPKSFVLLGHKYKIVQVPDLLAEEDVYGDEDYSGRQIRIQPKAMVPSEYTHPRKGPQSCVIEVTDEQVIDTYFHETFHAILDSIGEEELSENEKFVNLVAKAMLEIYLSSDYEEESTPAKNTSGSGASEK